MSLENNRRWAGETLGIATCHGKEHQIGPILSDSLGVSWVVPTDLDTDQLGTFTGERPRVGDPWEVARKKIALGHDRRPDVFLWVASEGSFGPHPTVGFLPSDEEWILFQDLKRGWEVSARVISLATNYQSGWFSDWASLQSFAHSVGFPAHGLILRPSQEIGGEIVKDFSEEAALHRTFQRFEAQYGGAYVLTDMRAMRNPSRQAVIQEATRALVKKMNTACPACHSPGYSVETVVPGLPCAWCGAPTRSPLEAIWACTVCQHTHTQKYPLDRTTEDPGFCDYCNP